MRPRFALLLLALLAILFFADLVLHPRQMLYSDFSDFPALHLPSRYFLVRSFHETGELPLWCPYNFGGMPFLADIQVSAFYPPHWLLLAVPEDRQGAACSWLIVAHVIVAGWCMYAYARHQGLQGSAAFVTAAGYMFAGKWLFHVLGGGHYNMVPLAWLPLVLLLLEQAIQRKSFSRAVWAGAIFALFVLAAYPYVTLYAGLFIALWTLGTTLESGGWWTEGRSWPALRPALVRWLAFGAVTVVVAALLGAVQLLPGLEIARESSRNLGIAPDLKKAGLDALRCLLGLAGPPMVADATWQWEDRGGLGLVWAGAALMAYPLNRTPRTRFELTALFIWLGLALGGILIFQQLPGFHFFQIPSRMLLLAALPVSLLVGRTTQALFAEPLPDHSTIARCRGLMLRACVVLVLLPVVQAIAVCRQGVEPRLSLYWISAVLLVPLFFWVIGSPQTKGRQAIWLTLLLVDLWAMTWPLVGVRPEAELYQPSPSVEYVMQHRGEHGRVLACYPVPEEAKKVRFRLGEEEPPLWAGLPMVHEIESIRGFNPIDVRRYKEYLRFINNNDRPLRPYEEGDIFTRSSLASFPIENPNLADLLGIRYFLIPSDLPLKTQVADLEQWKRVLDDPQPHTFNFLPSTVSGQECGLQQLPPFTLYENQAVLPRAFIVPSAQELPGKDQVMNRLKSADFRQSVFLEEMEWPKDAGSLRGPRSRFASYPGEYRAVAIKEYLPNRITVEVEGDPGGYLVLADVWYPGWRCEVDGQPVTIYRANYLFRAVELPPGAKEVRLIYDPPAVRVGKTISLIAVLVVLVITVCACLPFRMWRQPLEKPCALG